VRSVKIASQLGLAPGKDTLQKFENLRKYGFEGVEVGGWGLKDMLGDVQKASEKTGLPVTTICAGYGGCPLDSDPKQRQIAVREAKELLSMAADLGAVGMIFVPIFGGPRVPDLSPLYNAIELEKLLVAKIVEDLGQHAEKAGTLLLLEPLNRGETHFWQRLSDAVEIAEKVASPGVKIMADFYHMNIEEPHLDESIREAGDWIAHVHLADSHRQQPGTGHTDFKSGFKALKDIGFDQYMALECGITGDPEKALPACVEYLKSCI